MDAYSRGLEAVRRRPRRRPHRGSPASPASSSAASTPRSIGGSRRSAPTEALGAPRQGRHRPGQARLQAVPRHVQRRALGRAWRPAAPGCSGRCGPARHQEPGLPRHALRRRVDRARHGEHAARRHARGVRGSRHAGPARRCRRRRGRGHVGGARRRRRRHGRRRRTSSNAKGVDAFRRASTNCSTPSTPRPTELRAG